MAREKKVADASVIVKWFLNEADSEQALRYRDEHINGQTLLVVPELAFVEVLNVLRYKSKKEDQLKESIQALFDIQLCVQRLNTTLLEKTLLLALKYDLSIYDALYAATAAFHDAPLITADKALLLVPQSIKL